MAADVGERQRVGEARRIVGVDTEAQAAAAAAATPPTAAATASAVEVWGPAARAGV